MKNTKITIICVAVLTTALISGAGNIASGSVAIAEAKTAGSGNAAAEDSVKHKVMAFDLEGLSDSGAKKWGVTGKSAEAVSENRVKLNDIVATAYGDEAAATITAKDGVYNKTKNNVVLQNDVVATIESNKGFAGDFVGMQDSKTDKDVKNPSAGEGSQKKTKTVITCDGEVEFNYENNQAYFSKNVKVKSEDGDIDADKITVNLDPDTRQVKEIVAEGNVKIMQGENITYSDRAVYMESQRKILLTGRPKLVIYQEGGITSGLLGEKKK